MGTAIRAGVTGLAVVLALEYGLPFVAEKFPQVGSFGGGLPAKILVAGVGVWVGLKAGSTVAAVAT